MKIKVESVNDVIVVLDESLYGFDEFLDVKSGEYEGQTFYECTDKGLSKITTRLSRLNILCAVTKEQYNSWKNKKIVAVPVKIIIENENKENNESNY